MCGISGIVGRNINRKFIEAMVKVQEHRGPDANGIYFNEEQGVALGHNRLSIIDLSEGANQPFFSSDKRYIVVFNGEIYNYLELKVELSKHYTFRTQSDTEVLLASYMTWGDQCLNRLIGMFSFAIWDSQKEVLFGARDRFGVKPFYFHFNEEESFVFASEIKAIHKSGKIKKKLNEESWFVFLKYGMYGKPGETFWDGINELPGGHAFTFNNNELKIFQWYDFIGAVSKLNVPKDEKFIEEAWLGLAKESIRLRFRSDVKVGFNLSGGLDSSFLLALVQEEFGQDKSIEAFTFYTGDINYDEYPYVKKLIDSTRFPLNKVKLEVDKIPELFAKVAYYQDEPYGGIPTLAYSNIFKKARENGTIVLLDGQGMDEAWAGYDYYWNDSKSIVQGSKDSPLMPDCISKDLCFDNSFDFPAPFDNDLQNKQYRDLFYTKIPRSLRFNDRVSMMYSTELREPFLDHRMVEFAFSLPTQFKRKDDQPKWLARKIATDYLGRDLALAPKRPVQTPQREWLKGELNIWVNQLLENYFENHKRPLLQKNCVTKCLKEFSKGNFDNSFFLWQWLSLSMLK